VDDTKISELFKISGRFLRSAHLEKDFYDASGLEDYILSDYIQNCLQRISIGLKKNSGQRAWRITGDYGAGKSSFALFLAHWFSGKSGLFPKSIKEKSNYKLYTNENPQFTPVLVTGSRAPLGISILKELYRCLKKISPQKNKIKFLKRIQSVLQSDVVVTDNEILNLILEANHHATTANNGYGLLIIIDELGKFLEYAVLYPESQDVYLLQRLAELASRSDDSPFFIIGLLHQGFDVYADQLSQTGQREWEKISARFEELIFNQPIEQTTTLISSALNIKIEDLNRNLTAPIKKNMAETIKIGWFGASPAKKILLQNSAAIFPLHPTVLPVLMRIFNRFGQNERSLFSFLLSNEPFGLQEFSKVTTIASGQYYRLDNLYDYVRFNFGHRLNLQSYKSHWNHIESMIESFSTNNGIDFKVVKTVGIINLVNQNDILATDESIVLSLESSTQTKKDVIQSIENLDKKRRILYHRGAAGGYCLWPHTSINLDSALEKAKKGIGSPKRVSKIVKDFIDPSPIVARRHYIQTGNLRFFTVMYCSVDDLNTTLATISLQDEGTIIIPLCETKDERSEALKYIDHPRLKNQKNILIAIPPYLSVLAGLIKDAQQWEWVARNTPELEADRFAAEEVSKQIDFSRASLLEKINSFIGLRQFTGALDLEWYQSGKQLTISSGRELLGKLSQIADDLYTKAPKIKNELVNRQNLSSAAAGARMRLIENLLSSPNKPYLGMDPEKKPPEMAIYLSTLKQSKVHQEIEGFWSVTLPPKEEDICNILPVLEHMVAIVKEKTDEKINVSKIFQLLKEPPFGIRDGLLPILLAVFKMVYEHEVAFYENGSFLTIVDREEFQRLIKVPDSFEIQYCKIEGVRANIFNKLLSTLGLDSKTIKEPELLDIVQPLCIFVSDLPTYVKNTKKISTKAMYVRDTILNTRDPAKLLFSELPLALEFSPFEPDTEIPEETTHEFVQTLKQSLSELKMAFPELKDRLKSQIIEVFNISEKMAAQYRSHLSERAEKVAITVTEKKLKAFSLRLFDDSLPESEWIESIASFLLSKPPEKWADFDEEQFYQNLAQRAQQFSRVENIIFPNGEKSEKIIGMRLALTKSNGREQEKVFFISPEEEQEIKGLQVEFSKLIQSNKNGIAAAYKAIWEAMSSQKTKEKK
jgi:hypothetical protein